MSALPKRPVIRLGPKDYELKELSFGDLADLQEQGVEFDQLAQVVKDGGQPTFRQVGTLLWVCCRRRGSPDEPWHPKLEHFMHSIKLEDVKAAMPQLLEVALAPLAPSPTESTG